MKKSYLYIFDKSNKFSVVLTNPSDKEKAEHENSLLNPKVLHLKHIPMEFWLRNGSSVTVDPDYRKGESVAQIGKREVPQRSEAVKDLKSKVMNFRNDSLRARILRNKEIAKLDQDKTFHIKVLYFINIVQALCLLGFAFKEQILDIVIG